MEHPAMSRARPSVRVVLSSIPVTSLVIWSLAALQAYANTDVPWECSNYEGAAQTRCMNAFIEQQRETIARLEAELRSQQGAVKELKDKVDRQAAATADVQRQLPDRSSTSTLVVPAPYPFWYAQPYPPVGFGIYFGRPWAYGPPYWAGPYWGPRFYGRWRHRW